MARTILVPLDATAESATVLDTVCELARVEGATVRLLHVAPPPEAVVNDDGQVIAYADQETDRVEHKVTVFLKNLLGRLSGVRTELAVRFGDPAEEIVREAESEDVELIAMATHRRKRGRTPDRRQRGGNGGAPDNTTRAARALWPR